MEDSVITEHRPDILECLVDLRNDEVFTPPKVASEVLDLLPADIWQDKNAKFLDPCCKSGVFLREIAMRLNEGLKEQIPNAEKRKNHILKNQVYGIAITEFTSWVSRRTLYCSRNANGSKSIANHLFNDEKGNIMYDITEHNWDSRGKCIDCGASEDQFGDKEQESHAYQFIHDRTQKGFQDMEFDVIIGNPPYQIGDGGHNSSAMPLYNKFVNQAKQLKPKYLTMIIPARWYAGGKGLDAFRENMINDTKISKLVDYPNAKECFPNAKIPGGICYFLWDVEYNGKCEVTTKKKSKIVSKVKRYLNEDGEILVRDQKAREIIEKVQRKKENTYNEVISARKPFGLANNFKCPKTKTDDIITFYMANNKEEKLDREHIKINEELIDKHKVIIPSTGYIPTILSKPRYAGPKTACSETYVIVGTYKNKKECERVIQYIKTKFFRFLAKQGKITHHATRKIYKYAPIQEVSKDWTDEDLYKKYELTEEEINYIEDSIRVME